MKSYNTHKIQTHTIEFHIEPDLLCKSGVNRIYLSVTIVEPIKSQLGTVMPDPMNNHIYLMIIDNII